MKKLKLLFLTGLMSLTMCIPAFAGSWTHTMTTQAGSRTNNNTWYYVKDDGQYAKNEWVVSDDGVWYWFNNNCMVPNTAGVSDDGYLYNSEGIMVNTSDGSKKYLTEDLSDQITEGLTHEQVIAILGEEHEIKLSSQSSDNSCIVSQWYSEDAKGRQCVYFTNGIVSSTSSYWY